MKASAAFTARWLAEVLCTFAFTLLFAVIVADAQQPVMTSHVPDAVASGVAPSLGGLPGERRLSLALSLPLRDEAELDDLLQNLYDPQSPNYHNYLSTEEFTERFGATEADYAAVIRFAESNGLRVIDKPANRMVLNVEGTVASIEGAFHITLELFQHPTENRTFYAPNREPSVDLDVPVLHISGLDNFSPPRAKNTMSVETVSSAAGSGPGGSFLGSDLRAAYYGSGPLNGAGQSVGIFAMAGYQVSDIDLYFRNAHQPRNVPIRGVSLNGASLTCPPSSCNDVEQSLDIEQAISMAPGLSQLVVYVGKQNVSILNQMAADNTSKQLSCSYGWADNQSSVDPIFKEMAAQGQTIFVATGDQGSSTPAGVVWPSDDPWVTAVGGTDLTIASAGGAWTSETGWVNSAGMPSKNRVPIPSYQQMAGVVTSANHASATLRNIPDVASESDARNYVCAMGICKEHGAGTSYAAPLWASFIAMVNQQAAANGKAPIGFLNPALYTIGTGSNYTFDIHDIRSGTNGAYSAVTGYDLVTGWGSPKGANLINALNRR